MYLPELDATFIHVPKTGGTWVETVLRQSGFVVEPARGGGSHNVPEAYANPGFRFCFVRHPLTFYESLWRNLHVNWPRPADEPALFRERAWSPTRFLARTVGRLDFDEFVEAVLAGQPGLATRLYEAYVGFPGTAKVDAAGRMEGQPHHLQAILHRLGWHGTLAATPPQNVGEGAPVTWNARLLERVLDSEAPAIQRFYGGDRCPPASYPQGPDFVEVW